MTNHEIAEFLNKCTFAADEIRALRNYEIKTYLAWFNPVDDEDYTDEPIKIKALNSDMAMGYIRNHYQIEYLHSVQEVVTEYRTIYEKE